MRDSPFKSGSWAVFFLLGVAAAYAVTQAILHREADSLARIAGGSMAPALLGDHFDVTCSDCGFAFSCGAESPPDRDLATCPNCGFQKINVGDLQPHRGQRVRIDRAAWRAGAPRRWDLVALRRRDQPGRLAIKRLVGLPGERVAVRGGEIYVDGRLLRKPLNVFRRMAVLVYDDAYRPDPSDELPPRWSPKQPDAWTDLDGLARRSKRTYREPSEPARLRLAKSDFLGSERIGFRLVGEQPAGRAPALSWLIYEHWPGLPAPSRRVLLSPVWDHLGYNQAASRSLNEVHDLILQFDVRVKGAVDMAVRGDARTKLWQVDLSVDSSASPEKKVLPCKVTLLCDGRKITAAAASLDKSQAARVELALVDEQVFFAIDGKTVLEYVDEEAATAIPRTLPVTRPFSIGAAGRAVEISRLRISRDLYYLHPWGHNADWEMNGRLAEDEIFVLGDNCPASNDSRNWSPHGVRLQDVLGYVRPLAGEN